MANEATELWWRNRGYDDACEERAPLFKRARVRGIYAALDTGWDWEPGEEVEAGEAYLAGYAEAEDDTWQGHVVPRRERGRAA